MPVYLKSIRNTLLQFLDVFNNITVNKYNKAGVLQKTVTVPVKMANKERSYIYIKDNKVGVASPMIAVELQAIMYSSDKTTGKEVQIVFDKNLANKSYSYYFNPAPYQFDIAVHIIGRYVVEVDQILEQILCVFNPFIQTRIKVSDYSDQTFDIKIIFTGATPTFGPEFSEVEYRLASWTLNFSIHTVMFKPAVFVDPNSGGGLISSVINRYWFGENVDYMDTAIASGDVSSDTPSLTGGYTSSTITSGLGYDESAELLYSYQIFEEV
jgi:hypothetical protein